MIGVFDTTFGDQVILTSEDMVVFAQIILRHLNDFPDAEVIFKEKVCRDEMEDFPEVFESYDQLQRHERCLFVGRWAETSVVSAICDPSLSIRFTSPTVEALGARKRARATARNGPDL